MAVDNIPLFAWIFVAVLCPRATLAQREGDVRLDGGYSSSEGRVEIYHNNQWGTVCDDYWDDVDADVVCKQLNYNRAIRATDRAYFGRGDGPVWLDNVDCTGIYESKLSNCSHGGWGVAGCSHSEDAGAICTNSQAANGDIRLSDGLLLEEGRVEIYYDGVWGTICDDGWGYDEARVACYQLGYSGVADSVTYYGSGEGSILLGDVSCYGWESELTSCYHYPWYSHDCGHSEDVGIRCYRSSSGNGMSGWLISIIVISSLFVCGALIAVLASICSKNKSKRNRNMQHRNVAYQTDTNNTTITTTGSTQPSSYMQPQPGYAQPMAYGMAPPPSYTATMGGTFPPPADSTGAPCNVNPAAAYPPPSPSTTALPAVPSTVIKATAYPPPPPPSAATAAYPPQPATAPPTTQVSPVSTAAASMPTSGAMDGASAQPPTEEKGNVNPTFQA